MNTAKDDFKIQLSPKKLLNHIRLKESLIGEKEEKMYDMILDELGVTWYSKKIYTILLLFFFADGAEMVVISLLTSKLGEEWDLTTSEKGILGSSVFVGFFLGALISGKLSDTRGRKPIFISGSLIVTVFAFLSAFARSYQTFLIFRGLCGFGIGVSLPAAFALTTEVTPTKYRAMVLNGVWAFFPIGAIFVIILARLFLNIEDGWRYIMAFSTLPCLVAFILSCRVYESPKFFICSGDLDEGFKGIETMISYSNTNFMFDAKIKEKLIRDVKEAQANQVEANYKALVSEEFIKLSTLVWAILFLVSFAYYGLTYILPQTLEVVNKVVEKESGDFNEIYLGLIISALSELPSVFLSGYLANLPYLGRIKSMAGGFFIATFSTLCCFFKPSQMVLFASISKFALSLPFNIMFLYICEAYPTKIRSIAMGVSNSFTRFGGIVTPFISQIFFSIDYNLPFFIFGLSSIIGFICTLLLPIETYNRRID